MGEREEGIGDRGGGGGSSEGYSEITKYDCTW